MAIQKGVGEKMGNVIYGNFLFIMGLGIGLSRGWSLGLTILAALPVIAIGIVISFK